jgi:hypothetical protein
MRASVLTRSLLGFSCAVWIGGCGLDPLEVHGETDGGADAGGGAGGGVAGQGGDPGRGGAGGSFGGAGGDAGAGGGGGGAGGSIGGGGGSLGGAGGSMGGAGGVAGGGGAGGSVGGAGGTFEVGEGQECGGFRMAPVPICSKGLFCEMPAGSCNIADGVGKCARSEGACPDIFAPVCGCDGKTYENDCSRRASRAQLDHAGMCGGGMGGGVGAACGGIAARPCQAGLFCDPTPGQCGFADGGGSCQRPPIGCTKIFAPVCGCDGNTYGNDCLRQAAKAPKKADGACGSMRLQAGVWGGNGANLIVKDPVAGGSIELDCAHGTIDVPLDLTSDGSFKWKGTLVSEGGPRLPPPGGGVTRTAIFTGAVSGGVMKLQIILDNGGAQNTLVLTLGTQGMLHKCL